MKYKIPKNEEIVVLHKCVEGDINICINEDINKKICNLSNELASEHIYHIVLRDVKHGDHIRLLCDMISICHRDVDDTRWIYEWRYAIEDKIITSEIYINKDTETRTIGIIDYLININTLMTR